MPLDPRDWQQVADLMVRYAYAADEASAKQLFEIFSEDAVIEGPWGRFTGVEGLKRFAERFTRRATDQPTIRTRHLITNVLVDGDGDEARLRAYYMQVDTDQAPDAAKPLRSVVRSTGRYDCRARRIGGSWRLVERRIVVDAPGSR